MDFRFILQITLFLFAVEYLKVSAFKKCSRSKYNSNSFDKRIVNGDNALPGEFPWLILLPRGPCGGSVINEDTIITAAHCVYPPDAVVGQRVVAAEHIRSKFEGTEQFVNIVKVIPHPKYDIETFSENDIAILKVFPPLNLSSESISPICLPKLRQTFEGPCIVSGWGKLQNGGISSDVLQKVTLPLVSDKICNQTYGNLIESQLCAGYSEGGKSSCQGDSGGSLICKGPDNEVYLAGIVSAGVDCGGLPQYYGIYTEVSFFTEWIANTI